jgi:hypothetical protein
MGGDAGDDLAGSRKKTKFRGVHEVIYIYPVKHVVS